MLGEERVAEPLQDALGEMDEIHLGEGNVDRDLISGRLVVQLLWDSPIAWADRRDNTHVDLEVQPLCVDVVRFAVVVVAHLEHDGGGVVSFINTVIVVKQDETKVGSRLRTVVDVVLWFWKRRCRFSLRGKGSCMWIASKKCTTCSVEKVVWSALVKGLG